VPFLDQDIKFPGTWDLVALPEGIAYEPELGLVRSSADPLEAGRIVLRNTERARVVGRVARDGRDDCPGTPLAVEQVESLPPDAGEP
jgi:hypothetical protein